MFCPSANDLNAITFKNQFELPTMRRAAFSSLPLFTRRFFRANVPKFCDPEEKNHEIGGKHVGGSRISFPTPSTSSLSDTQSGMKPSDGTRKIVASGFDYEI
jgi:hypothetical protein